MKKEYLKIKYEGEIMNTIKTKSRIGGFILIYLLLSPFIFVFSQAQTAIPEGNFDNWTPASSGLFEEPTGGWWTTLNSLVQLGGPVTVTKTTDAYSGTYAAQMETQLWGTLVLPGLLASGKFANSSPFVIQGKPFTDMPVKFKGYYKYTCVNIDSAGIYAMLSHYNTVTGKRDTLAEAKKAVLATVQNYTAFDLDFHYYITGVTPDSIDIVFVSSSGSNGQVGSTFFVDDVSLEYSNGLQENVMPKINVLTFPNPANDEFHLIIENSDLQNITCDLYSMEGKLCRSFVPVSQESSVNIKDLTAGNYLLNIYKNQVLVLSNKISIIR